jgi:hypothetical protein
MSAYRLGLSGRQAEWAVKKMSSHRRVHKSLYDELMAEQEAEKSK